MQAISVASTATEGPAIRRPAAHPTCSARWRERIAVDIGGTRGYGRLAVRKWPVLSATKKKTSTCGRAAAVFGTRMVGRERTVSRVLYPLRDGDHLSWTPVARR